VTLELGTLAAPGFGAVSNVFGDLFRFPSSREISLCQPIDQRSGGLSAMKYTSLVGNMLGG